MNTSRSTKTISLGRFVAFPIRGKFILFDSNSLGIYTIPEALYKLLAEKDEAFVFDLLQGHLLKDVSIPRKPSRPEPLTSVTINISQTCNLRCIYCYGNGGEYGMKGMMSLDTAKRCVDFLFAESQSAKIVMVTFFGGEPLLNFEVLRETTLYALRRAEELGKTVRFSITTNGTLFSKTVNDFLNAYNFSVTISFDGDKRIQDANRPCVNGKGSFDIILPKVTEFLASRNGRATARATLTDKSTDVKQIERTLKQYGFKRVYTALVTVSEHNSSESLSTITLDDPVTLNKFESIKHDARQILLSIKHRSMKDVDMKNDVMLAFRELFTKRARYNFCGVGRKLVAIACNGDVYPCHRFVGDESFRLGNISSFDSSTRSSYSSAFLYSHPICSKCWVRFFCGGGGCIQDNYFTNGDPRSLNPVYCAKVELIVQEAIGVYLELSDNDKAYLKNGKSKNHK